MVVSPKVPLAIHHKAGHRALHRLKVMVSALPAGPHLWLQQLPQGGAGMPLLRHHLLLGEQRHQDLSLGAVYIRQWQLPRQKRVAQPRAARLVLQHSSGWMRGQLELQRLDATNRVGTGRSLWRVSPRRLRLDRD